MSLSIANKAIILSASALLASAMVACDSNNATSPEDTSSDSTAQLSSSSIAIPGSSESIPGSSAGITSSSDGAGLSSGAILSSSSDNGLKAPTGSFTDSRDGKTYKLTEIGTQTWMAENLTFADSNFYSYDDAIKVCPEGFHLPAWKEFQTLVDYVGGFNLASKKLKSTSGWPVGEYGDWNGTDDYGFNAKPNVDGDGKETDQNFWSSTLNFHNDRSADFLKLNPYATSKPADSTNKRFGPFCYDPNKEGVVTKEDVACVINGDRETKLAVRCLSNVLNCGGIGIDYTKQFCQNDRIYDFCIGMDYDASKYECKDNNLYEIGTDKVYKRSWEFLNKTLEYGTYIDKRDGQVYKTIDIDGIVYFAENLNYASEGSRCYDDKESNCSILGRHYTVSQAVDKSDTSKKIIQGICPEGTHLMTSDEYEKIIGKGTSVPTDKFYASYDGGEYSNHYKNNKNLSGFSLIFAGCYDPNNDEPWSNLHSYVCMVNKRYVDGAFEYYFRFGDTFSAESGVAGSVRCVLD